MFYTFDCVKVKLGRIYLGGRIMMGKEVVIGKQKRYV